MNNLITVNENETVDGRDLWEALEIDTPFNKWLPRRIADYKFEDGKDFVTILSKSTGGRKATNYHLSIDMAKELAMVEKTKVGKKIRHYFIKCEKELRDKSIKRLAGKEVRKTLTDRIKESGENERMHGHGYSNYTRMVYKLCGIEYKKSEKFRDTLSREQLDRIQLVESLVKNFIELGKNYAEIKKQLIPILDKKQIGEN